jgi:diguanylate cyclase (GGDEF)-like protein
VAEVVEGLDAGADDYITRPYASQEFRARLQAGCRIIRLQERLVQIHEELYQQATRDSLTGLWNRTAAIQILDREIARATRAQTPIALIMADVDRFKRINDAHGHLAGDVVLREAAERMSGALRKYDSIGRYGGEEFLVVLPGCQFRDALSVAERLRDAVGSRPFPIAEGLYSATCSLGLAWDDCRGPLEANRLLREADQALYAAKHHGRNRVEVFQPHRPNGTGQLQPCV